MNKKITCYKCKLTSEFKLFDTTCFVKSDYVKSGWIRLDFSEDLSKNFIEIFLCNMCADSWRAELSIIKKEYEDKIKLLQKSFLSLENVTQLFAYSMNIKKIKI